MTHPHPLHLTSYITTRSTVHPSPTTRTTGKPPLTPHRYTSTPTPPQTPVSPLMSHTSHHLSHQITHTTPHLHHHSHGLTPIPPTILVYITTHTPMHTSTYTHATPHQAVSDLTLHLNPCISYTKILQKQQETDGKYSTVC